MDFFDGRNYRVNKILLSAIGQWPYQSSKTNYIITIVITTITCSQLLTKLCSMFSYIHDMEIVIECLTPIMIDISGITKIMNSMLCVNEMRTLLDQIQADFRSLRNSGDIEILQKYADSGRKFSIIYIYTLYIVMVIFMLTPLPALILHVANETRPMLHRVEYYVDIDKYYFPILIHGYLTVLICVTSIVATDAMLVIFVQHACGMFIITGSRIKRALQGELTDANLSVVEDKAYRNMIQCVHDHRAAIRLVNLIEAAYSKYILFHTGLNMIAISITGVGAVTKLNDPSELFKLIAVSWALLFHLCLECLNAQKLMDYSGYLLHTSLVNLNWYDASPRTKKLVLFMMMKTHSPCVLTAGGMFVLCMETYATIVKTAVSYFTFLRSAQ
ncbi:odorant receptor 4-like [Camponotus floridanus]|uniref:odorant receptor 4-like n=1 Tax=Camponotus floridanus TaxID=104421 RepID=UPI0009717233|nr:odorant receptor 4-like [Camponotus floridanus]